MIFDALVSRVKKARAEQAGLFRARTPVSTNISPIGRPTPLLDRLASPRKVSAWFKPALSQEAVLGNRPTGEGWSAALTTRDEPRASRISESFRAAGADSEARPVADRYVVYYKPRMSSAHGDLQQAFRDGSEGIRAAVKDEYAALVEYPKIIMAFDVLVTHPDVAVRDVVALREMRTTASSVLSDEMRHYTYFEAMLPEFEKIREKYTGGGSNSSSYSATSDTWTSGMKHLEEAHNAWMRGDTAGVERHRGEMYRVLEDMPDEEVQSRLSRDSWSKRKWERVVGRDQGRKFSGADPIRATLKRGRMMRGIGPTGGPARITPDYAYTGGGYTETRGGGRRGKLTYGRGRIDEMAPGTYMPADVVGRAPRGPGFRDPLAGIDSDIGPGRPATDPENLEKTLMVLVVNALEAYDTDGHTTMVDQLAERARATVELTARAGNGVWLRGAAVQYPGTFVLAMAPVDEWKPADVESHLQERDRFLARRGPGFKFNIMHASTPEERWEAGGRVVGKTISDVPATEGDSAAGGAFQGQLEEFFKRQGVPEVPGWPIMEYIELGDVEKRWDQRTRHVFYYYPVENAEEINVTYGARVPDGIVLEYDAEGQKVVDIRAAGEIRGAVGSEFDFKTWKLGAVMGVPYLVFMPQTWPVYAFYRATGHNRHDSFLKTMQTMLDVMKFLTAVLPVPATISTLVQALDTPVRDMSEVQLKHLAEAFKKLARDPRYIRTMFNATRTAVDIVRKGGKPSTTQIAERFAGELARDIGTASAYDWKDLEDTWVSWEASSGIVREMALKNTGNDPALKRKSFATLPAPVRDDLVEANTSFPRSSAYPTGEVLEMHIWTSPAEKWRFEQDAGRGSEWVRNMRVGSTQASLYRISGASAARPFVLPIEYPQLADALQLAGVQVPGDFPTGTRWAAAWADRMAREYAPTQYDEAVTALFVQLLPARGEWERNRAVGMERHVQQAIEEFRRSQEQQAQQVLQDQKKAARKPRQKKERTAAPQAPQRTSSSPVMVPPSDEEYGVPVQVYPAVSIVPKTSAEYEDLEAAGWKRMGAEDSMKHFPSNEWFQERMGNSLFVRRGLSQGRHEMWVKRRA